MQDFDGQARAEKLYRFIITLFGLAGLVWGGIIQQFSQTVLILSAGFVLAALVKFIAAILLLFSCFHDSLCSLGNRAPMAYLPPQGAQLAKAAQRQHRSHRGIQEEEKVED